MKRKLLFVAAVVASALGFNANAQRDVTAQYLANPSFETSPIFDGTSLGAYQSENATPTEGSTTFVDKAVNLYKIAGWTNYEVADGGTAYERVLTMPYSTTLYISAQSSTGAIQIGEQAVAAPANESSDQSEDNKNLLVVQASWSENQTVAIKQETELSKGLYKLAFDTYVTTTLDNVLSLCGVKVGGNGTYVWPTELGKWATNEIYFTVDEDGTSVEISMGYLKSKDGGAANTPFLFIDNVKLYQYNKNVPESVPVENKIANPNASEGSTIASPWEAAGSNLNQAKKINSGTGFDGNKGFFEPSDWDASSWNSTISQKLTGLENGLYTLKAAVQSGQTGDATNKKGPVTVLMAGTSKSAILPVHNTTNGTIDKDGNEVPAGEGVDGWNYGTVNALVTDGTLTIGVYSYAKEQKMWTNIDNFTLSYIPASELEAVYSVTIADAENGTVAADKAEAKAGEDINLTVTPAEDYKLDKLTVTYGEDNTAVEVADNKFTMPDGDVTVSATFAKITGKFKGEGVYYIYNEATGKFLSRGSWYGTRAFPDEYGLPIQVSLAEGKEDEYNLQVIDTKLYYGDSEWMYADCSGDRVRNYVISEVEGKDGTYTITNTDNNKNVYVNTKSKDEDDVLGVAGNAILGDNYDDANDTYWKFLSAEERDAILEERVAAVVQSVAEKADVESLEHLISAGDPVSVSFKKDAWGIADFTKRNIRDKQNVNDVSCGVEVYEGVKKFTKTVSDLSEGLYLVSIQGFFRGGWNDQVAGVYDAGYDCVLSYLDANGATVRLSNWAEECTTTTNDKDETVYLPNTPEEAEPLFTAGKYIKSVVTYVGEDGKLDLAVMSPSFTAGCWLLLNNVTYTPLKSAPTYEVEVKDESGYASYVTEADVTFDGVKAYIVSEVIEGDELPKAQLVAITEAPEGTPVIVEAEVGTHTIYAVDKAEAIEDGANLLKVGTGEETGEGVYVLANPADGVGIGFYALENEVKVPEGKAYLKWTAAAPVKFIGFDGYEYDATAIKVVETPAPAVENGIYYNLSGQRVQAPTKGIYIVNGKKVLVK